MGMRALACRGFAFACVLAGRGYGARQQAQTGRPISRRCPSVRLHRFRSIPSTLVFFLESSLDLAVKLYRLHDLIQVVRHGHGTVGEGGAAHAAAA